MIIIAEFEIDRCDYFIGKIGDIDTTMQKAEAKGIQVVPEDILDEFQADPSNSVFLITKKNIAPWGSDVSHEFQSPASLTLAPVSDWSISLKY